LNTSGDERAIANIMIGKRARLIGRLRELLLSPNEAKREGYVPNVVYTCGAMLHGHELIIPYAMSGSAISFATVSVG
jgi:predicted GH43/DUF377 family glycosyl hydrolase